MDINIADKVRGGVDLNRNFGFQYGIGRSNKDEIANTNPWTED